ncbi:MAG: murein biosynthesis integral membrane protein MurJ [Aggregatilineales bacterium]
MSAESVTVSKTGLSLSQIARAAGVVMISFVLTGVLGIVRQAVVGARFGLSPDMDAYNAANRVSETLFTLVSGGALGSAFIPVFSRFLRRDDAPGAWRLASVTATVIGLAGTALAIIVVLLAVPIVANFLVPEATLAQQALTVHLLRPMLVTVVIFGLSGLSMAILNAHQRFLAAALAPSLYNVGLIIGAAFLAPLFGIDGLAYGTVLGAALHLVVQLPTLLRLPGARQRLRPQVAVQAEGVGEVFRLMAPRVFGLGMVQVNFWVNTALVSGMVAGSLTALTNAFALLFTVLGVLGQSVGTAVFPTLAALNAGADVENFRRVLASALRSVLFMSLPATVGLIVLAEPLIAAIYGRGAWTPTATEATAWALRFYAIGLVGFALQEVLARAFYALHDTQTPVLIAVIGVILNVGLSLALIRVVQGGDAAQGPFGGLALANALATIAESVALWLLIRRTIGGIEDRAVLNTAARTAIAALAMGAVVYGLARVLATQSPFVILGVGALIGVIAFELLALALGIAEARSLPGAFLRRVRR